MAFALNHGSHSHHLLHYVLVILLPVSQLGSRGHQQKFHCLPQVEVEVLVSTGHKSSDFIAVNKVGDEFSILYTPIDDDFMEGRAAFPYKVDGLVSYSQRSHGEVAEFYSLVKHTHSCKKACFNVIFCIICSNSNLMQERRVLSATAGCQYR